MKPIIVTTSWDDGDPLDLRLAELLAKYGVKGTFYLPLNRKGKPVDVKMLAGPLTDMGMEIGSHTVSHPVLTSLRTEDIRTELRDSKHALEQMLGREVTSFCYPKGAHNRRIAALSKQAGYRLGRTTLAFHTSLAFDPARMPVSCQICPQSVSALARHAVKKANWSGLLNWWRRAGFETGTTSLSRLFLASVRRSGGVLHLWGHSWELERHRLWDPLEELLKEVSSCPGALYLTNSEVLRYRVPVSSGYDIRHAPTVAVSCTSCVVPAHACGTADDHTDHRGEEHG